MDQKVRKKIQTKIIKNIGLNWNYAILLWEKKFWEKNMPNACTFTGKYAKIAKVCKKYPKYLTF